MLVSLMPDEPEAVGLLALLILSEARMPARRDGARIVLLKDRDRSAWDRSLIADGQALVLACMRRRRLGPFQLQAAIQALHCAALRYEGTDWTAIVRFYDRLIAVMTTPVVALNRAIAVAETNGPETGLALLDDVAEELNGYQLLLPSADRSSKGLAGLARQRMPTTAQPRWRVPTPTSPSWTGGAPSSPATCREAQPARGVKLDGSGHDPTRRHAIGRGSTRACPVGGCRERLLYVDPDRWDHRGRGRPRAVPGRLVRPGRGRVGCGP